MNLIFFMAKNIKKKTNIIYVLFVFFIQENSYARWYTKDDATHIINFYNRDIEINSNGTFTQVDEVKVTLTKDDQSENIVTRPFQYNPNLSTLKILSAYTIFEGKKYVVKNSEIEDKSIASSIEGFSSTNQVLIKYPNVKKGAELYLKYIMKVNKTKVPNLFSANFIYNFDGYLIDSNIKVTSKIPFYMAKNDLSNILDIKESKLTGKQILEIKIKKPYLKGVVDEDNPYFNNLEIPWVMISTYNNWNKLTDIQINKYESILAQKLPDIFENIAYEAAKKVTLNEKIDTVTSLLADKVKYMGDWRSLESSYYPRNLAEIAHSGQGDCKDYSISTVAILRKIGISSHVAAVYRSENYQESPVFLPSMSSFNHMIVQVKDNEKIKWIDPTHFASYAKGQFLDISDRNALVFDPNSKGIEKIPALKADNYQVSVNEVHDYSIKKQLKKEGEIEYKGNAAIFLAGAGLRMSKDVLENRLVNIFSGQDRVLNWYLEDYNLNSRIVTDKVFKYKIVTKPYEVKTDLGIGYPLVSLSSYADMFLINTINRKSDLLIENPSKYRSVILLKNIFRSKKSFNGCHIKSKWALFSRNILDKKEGVEVIDEVEIIQNHILNKELLSKEFEELQEQLEACIKGVVIIASSDKYME